MLNRLRQPNVWIALFSIALLIGFVWRWGGEILYLAQDEAALQAFVTELDWFGPFALVALNILQTVVAPIPGHAIYVAAGFLFGSVKGSFWGLIGMLGGALTAMVLSRVVGRPLVVTMIGESRLTKWEQVTRSDDLIVWTLVLLSPIGDTPYLLAGLAGKIRFRTILLLAFLTRGPQVVVAASIGAGAMVLTTAQIALLFVLLAIPLVLFLRYQSRLNGWLYRMASQRVAVTPVKLDGNQDGSSGGNSRGSSSSSV